MGLIIKELQVAGDKGQKKEKVLFDNGSASSLIKKSVAEEIATIIKMPVKRKFKLGDGKTIIETDEVTNIFLEIDGKVIDDNFYVLKELGKEVIVGSNTMQSWDIVLEPKEEKIIVRRDPQAIEFFRFG